jgi:hypothetical protein
VQDYNVNQPKQWFMAMISKKLSLKKKNKESQKTTITRSLLVVALRKRRVKNIITPPKTFILAY